MAEQRRKFPREFKVEAVRRVIDSGETTTEVARRSFSSASKSGTIGNVGTRRSDTSAPSSSRRIRLR